MSLWWARREQLDDVQVNLIEELPLRESCLILGPPGSGKTNVLLRRAQFVRFQGMPNVLVLTFTRSLTEFIKTGCYDEQNREIFPPSCVVTIESWLRFLYGSHREKLPSVGGKLIGKKRVLATGAVGFQERGLLPKYDALFIDEAQDLLEEEISLLTEWSPVLFFVGDSRQKLFDEAEGLEAIRRITPPLNEYRLPFHYRLAPVICRMADRILASEAGGQLESTSQYEGPKPGDVFLNGPLDKRAQLEQAASKLKDQVRVYADLIQQGDRLGVIVARTEDREAVFDYFEADVNLRGKSKIIRAREEHEGDYDPTFETDVPICIVTVKGCKGLEFRAVHWLFSEELSYRHDNETYYTVVTRAKTVLDLYFATQLPQVLARAHAGGHVKLW
jgi:superfamily I DNA/RNA helicase